MIARTIEKKNHNHRIFLNSYFWRNYQKKEIDCIEEIGGSYELFECKYNINISVRKRITNNFPNNLKAFEIQGYFTKIFYYIFAR